MIFAMQQFSTTKTGFTDIQRKVVGPVTSRDKQSSNKVPRMWRLMVLQNGLPTSVNNSSDSALRVRFDAAHGGLTTLAQLNWSEQIGLPDATGLPAFMPIDCCAATAPVATTSVALQSAKSGESREFGERYRALLAEAAHDIRAPLGVARQILSRIATRVGEDGALTKQDRSLLASANDRLEQATTWVDGILLPNRLKQVAMGTMRQRFYPHQLRGIVEPVVNDKVREQSINLDWVGWDRSLPRLYLDANQLGRVLLNLVSNAIAASPRGSRVTLRITWQTNVTQRLVIAVEDEGRGLSAPLLRFINSAQMLTPPPEAGIGLVTVKSLMNAIGGSISAQVGPQGGTVFRVTVPVDNRLSLVRGWLIQRSQLAGRVNRNAKDNVQLHIVRSSGLDTKQVDQWLQQSSAQEDFVYRVSEDRWLWLSICSKSPTKGTMARAASAVTNFATQGLPQNGRLNCQLAAEWLNVELQSLHSNSNQSNLLPQLASAIADKFAALTGNHVPPINELKANITHSIKPPKRSRDLLRADRSNTMNVF